MNQGYITADDLKPLTKAYENAIRHDKVSFVYNDMEFDTAYAKYLIDYFKGSPR